MKEPQFITEGSFIEAAKKHGVVKGEKDYNETEKGTEKEKLTPIFIIYRDNDLFAKQVPEMVKTLSSMGRQVEVFSFPKESDEEDVEKWYATNKALLANKAIISDETAAIPWEMEEDILSSGAKTVGNLDDIISEITQKTMKSIFGNKYDELSESEKGSSEEDSKKWFISTISEILKNPENTPEKVVIFPDRITDHSKVTPFKKIMEEIKGLSREEEDKKFEQLRQVVSGRFKEWLITAGISPEKIILKEDVSSNDDNGLSYFIEGGEKVVMDADELGTWIIVDRHAQNIVEKIHNAKCLQLPEGNFFQTAIAQDLLKCTDGELNAILNETLEKKYGKN